MCDSRAGSGDQLLTMLTAAHGIFSLKHYTVFFGRDIWAVVTTM